MGLTLEEDYKKLPPMHWTTKMHKEPVSSRFIIGSKVSSLKPLGKCITRIFKVIFHHKKRYFRKVGFYSGLKHFWCIDKNTEITEMLDRVNERSQSLHLILPHSTQKYRMIN